MPFIPLLPLFCLMSVPPAAFSAPTTVTPNTVTVSDSANSGSAPLLISRVFAQREIANYPQAIIGTTPLTTQANVRSRWPDGAVRHAMLAFALPPHLRGTTVTVSFINQQQCNCEVASSMSRTDLIQLARALDISITTSSADIPSGTITRRLATMLEDRLISEDITATTTHYTITGPIATQVMIEDRTPQQLFSVPFTTPANAVAEPLLNIRAIVTVFAGTPRIRLDVIAENSALRIRSMLRYATTISAGPRLLYENRSVKHGANKRWRKQFWLQGDGAFGQPSGAWIDHNLKYIVETGALPNFDTSLRLSDSMIRNAYDSFPDQTQGEGVSWKQIAEDPAYMFRGDILGNGQLMTQTEGPGGRPELGLVCTWYLRYLYSMDSANPLARRLWEPFIGNAAAAGQMGIFLREDKFTDRPFAKGHTNSAYGNFVSLDTRHTFSMKNDVETGEGLARLTLFPPEDKFFGLESVEQSHLPAIFFVPYLITGDMVYYEDQMAVASFVIANTAVQDGYRYRNPHVYGIIDGFGELRGDAWGLREIAHAAFIAMDGSPEKVYFQKRLLQNIAAREGARGIRGGAFETTCPSQIDTATEASPYCWGYAKYVPNLKPSMNPLRSLYLGGGRDCRVDLLGCGRGGFSKPFEVGYMITTLYHIAELGFPARPLADDSNTFVLRLILEADPHIIGAYEIHSVDSASGLPIRTAAEAVRQSDPTGTAAWRQWANNFDSQHGYSVIMRAAASYLTPVTVGALRGADAWQYLVRNMPINPATNDTPQWAILPRDIPSEDAGVPDPPAAPVATTNALEVVLRWNTIARATSYVVLRSTTSGGPYSVVSTTTATSYSEVSSLPGTFFYAVSARNAKGDSPLSPEVRVNLEARLSALLGLRLQADGADVMMTWSAVTGADSYRIRRKKATEATYVTLGDTVSLRYTDGGVSAGTWHYTVAAVRKPSTVGPDASPVLIEIAKASGVSSSDAFITGVIAGTLRNDFTGLVGMKITIGAAPVIVTQLGRYVHAGNSQNHVVKIVHTGTGADVAAATVPTAGTPVGLFAYAGISAVTLQANTAYYLVSQESGGGDYWYDSNAQVSFSTVAVVNNAAYHNGGWVTTGVQGRTFIPVNFKYSLTGSGDLSAPSATITTPAGGATVSGGTNIDASATDNVGVTTVEFYVDGTLAFTDVFSPFSFTWDTSKVSNAGHTLQARAYDAAGNVGISGVVAVTVQNASQTIQFIGSTTLGTPRNDFTGWVGFKMTVGANPLNVTAVGRWIAAGNSQSHTVKFVEVATGADPPGGAATVSTAGQPTGQYAFASLGSPLVLKAYTSYYVVGLENFGGDTWHNSDTSVITSADAVINNAVYFNGSSWSNTDIQNRTFVPVNFRYSLGQIGDVSAPAISIASPAANATVSGPISLQASASDNTGVASVGYYIDNVLRGTSSAGNPFTVAFNTLLVANGSRSLTARAVDAAGNAGTQSITFNIQNAADTTAPSVSITAPTQGQAVAGTVTIAATASDNVAVSRVEFLVDGTLAGTSTSTPYTYTWDTSQAANGSHTLAARAVDPSNNANSASIAVTVQNTAAPGTAFVTSVQAGTVRNDFSGFAGMRLTIGGSPLTVVALGRYVLAGNNGSHALKIVNATTGADLAGGAATVSTAGVPVGQFAFGNLSAPTTLQANTTYYMVSQESFGGDSWYDQNDLVSTTTVATVNSAVYQGGGWVTTGVQNRPFVPVTFKYTTGSAPVDQTAPSVSIAASSNGAAVSGVVGLSASASDNVGVARVEFRMDGALVATVTTPTSGLYTYSWPSSQVGNGTHSIQAWAYDGANNSSSASISVTVNNTTAPTPPTVSLSAPSNGATVSGVVNVSAAAGDSLGIQRVEFLIDGVVKGTATSPSGGSYTFAWGTTSETNASHTVQARAVNTSGLSATSATIAVTVSNAASTGTAFVTGETLGTSRNDFSGLVGMRIATGPSAMRVTALGRYRANGNAGTHLVKLVLASSGADVAGSSAQVSVGSVGVGQYAYTNLAAPVALSANTIYYLVSEETAGGDTWSDANAIIATTTDAICLGPVYGLGANYASFGVQNRTFGPLNMRYSLASGGSSDTTPPSVAIIAPSTATGTVAISAVASDNVGVTLVEFTVDGVSVASTASSPYAFNWNSATVPNGGHTLQARAYDASGNVSASSAVVNVSNSSQVVEAAFVTGVTPGTARNDFAGLVGMRFTIGPSAVRISALGRYMLASNSGTHLLKLVSASNGQDVAGGSVTVSMAGGLVGQFRYAPLASPVTLAANTTYYLVSQEAQGGDQWFDLNTAVFTTGVATVNSGVYGNGGSYNATGVQNRMYVPVDFKYQQ